MRKIILHRLLNETRGAVLENGKVTEWLFDIPSDLPGPGSVIKGKVEDILPGMDAAFINIGSEKNGFLYKKEIAAFQQDPPQDIPVTSLVAKGQSIIVQVKKEESGSKGAKLTEHLAFPGKYVVYLPYGGYVAVSKKITPEETRNVWREWGKNQLEGREGLIIRTLADEVPVEEVKEDLERLKSRYSAVLKKAKEIKGTGTLYDESSIYARVSRDFLNDENSEIIVDSLEDYQQFTGGEERPNIELYQGKENIFSRFNIWKQLERALKPFLWLKNGGSLHIDHTEAMTVIDVNSAKFTGKQGLRDTAVKINLEAAKTIAEQLRQRDIGGIILIDFIDMADERDRQEVLTTLNEALKHDRTITNVLGFTQLGLLEMTRKKTRNPLRDIMFNDCPACQGTGKVKKEEEVARELEEAVFTRRYNDEEAIIVEIGEPIIPLFLGNNKKRMKQLEKITNKKIFLIPSSLPGFEIRYMGSIEEARTKWKKHVNP
ncbi:Rne/Rng family ribonuclease [Salipaludibacillus sp. CUR1]|uniref:Rne/Rng family ribonuclease n=1 Tax=Salipaludibacillus sp. CUR1 TaxID=2820003 RepID=UPI001E5D67CA|nr:Rne/Rng family ribonuclease [Salipaludibacillus sp. CUR1]